jgi:hypothetical protein
MVVGIETSNWLFKEYDTDNFLKYGDSVLNTLIGNARNKHRQNLTFG